MPHPTLQLIPADQAHIYIPADDLSQAVYYTEKVTTFLPSEDPEGPQKRGMKWEFTYYTDKKIRHRILGQLTKKRR